MFDEALFKLLRDNLCCLIHAALELGIEANFRNDCAEKKPAPVSPLAPVDNDIEALA